MHLIFMALISIGLATAAHAQGSRGKGSPAEQPKAAEVTPGPLAALLHRIPIAADGEIYMTDFAAARHNIYPLTHSAPSELDRLLIPFSANLPPVGFDRDRIFSIADTPAAAIGFSLFEFDQMAGWGTLPNAPVIATGIDDHHEAMIAAFRRDGLTPRDWSGVQAWFRGDDFEVDFDARNDSPFGGHLGMAQRMVLAGDTLLSARSWPTLETLIEPGTSLDKDADVAAMLRAIYTVDVHGDPINVLILPGQPPKLHDPALALQIFRDLSPADAQARLAELPAFALPSIPRFNRFALVSWQNGYVNSGAIVIPYTRRDRAETALDRFTNLLDGANTLSTRGPFAELLPSNRQFEIVESENRHVLILAFVERADPLEPINLMTFVGSPFMRMVQMHAYRDLPLLIGFN